jgi:hypothetical protein
MTFCFHAVDGKNIVAALDAILTVDAQLKVVVSSKPALG